MITTIKVINSPNNQFTQLLFFLVLRIFKICFNHLQVYSTVLLTIVTMCVLVTKLCPTLCNPMDCSPPGSSVHGILQARILEWVAIPFSRDLPTQEMILGLLRWGHILYHLSHQGSQSREEKGLIVRVTMLYIMFPELIHLKTGSLHLLIAIIHFSQPQASGNHQSSFFSIVYNGI